ncbi:hypothetical protein HNP52_003175 [Sphingomonas kyeonggiensis]|uniref:TonB C-terminal domain-containing protein n=1 Tax=Sphingomonas kyeonggiensis TaxID=1268553 RepID=A0A7W7K344_9SPHN|nr:energy transducer TonB [Sphingomonas kyeonggiensis]MBB4840083.1 hypothetical protein [Sphingomonas kyeonggiensis]
MSRWHTKREDKMPRTKLAALGAAFLAVPCAAFAQTSTSDAHGDVPLIKLAFQPVPEESRKLGHHGKVLVRGMLVAGHITSPSVILSSGAPELDSAAITIAESQTLTNAAGPVSGKEVRWKSTFSTSAASILQPIPAGRSTSTATGCSVGRFRFARPTFIA